MDIDWKLILATALAFGTALAAFFKGLFDIKPLKKRVAECEADRARLHGKIGDMRIEIGLLRQELRAAQGSVDTLTTLLKREIHLE
jgi:hypothetical protein